jgi:pantothenate synthetase
VKGLALARRNLALRKTSRAYELVLKAALAANESALACDAAEEARAVRHASPALRDPSAHAFAACAHRNGRVARTRFLVRPIQ